MSTRFEQVGVYAGAALVPFVFAGALVTLRGSFTNALPALLLVIIVLLAAIRGGRGPAITSAVAGFVAFNLFHTTPYYALTIDNIPDLEIALAFLFVGVLSGEITAWATRDRELALEDSYEIARLYRTARLVNARAPLQQVQDAVKAELRDVLELQAVTFEREPATSTASELTHDASIVTHDDPTVDGLRLPTHPVALEVRIPDAADARLVLHAQRAHRVHIDQLVTAITLADLLGERIAVHDQQA